MKILISFLAFLFVLTSCKKQDTLEPLTPAKNVTTLTNGIPVSFEYSSCERPEITFRGETYGEVTTITSDSTVTLRDDQQYSVSFRLTAERCSPGEIILSGDNPAEINFWLGTYPALAEKQHVNLESKYYVVVLGE